MKANILIVDDEAVARQSLTDILRLEGYHVAAVANGQAAIEYVRTHHVDLLVMDLRMPGMTGLEAIQVINQVSLDIEVIMLTAHGSMETAVNALRLRVHDYLLKPASPSQIIASIKKGLDRRASRVSSRSGSGDAPLEEQASIVSMKDGTRIDLARREISWGRSTIHLTPAEGRLLKTLIESPGRVFTHRDLVLFVQGYETSQREAPEILRPLVSRLRQKLSESPTLRDKISSIRGTGYVFEPD